MMRTERIEGHLFLEKTVLFEDEPTVTALGRTLFQLGIVS